IVGRVSMDLTVVDATGLPGLAEGDRVALGFDLPELSAACGLAEYELLTGLGRRFERVTSEAEPAAGAGETVAMARAAAGASPAAIA
ncbi:MAG: alanine racemase C-terminal domain-containing protein, partial [Sphingomonadaceae bacterium]